MLQFMELTTILYQKHDTINASLIYSREFDVIDIRGEKLGYKIFKN